MTLKQCYEQELEFMKKTLARCKSDVNMNGVVQYRYDGINRRGEVSPKIEVYNKVLAMYLKTLKEYTELCKSDDIPKQK